MFEIFAAYLKENAFLTDDEIEQIHACTILKRIRKRQYLLQEGEICHHNCFIAGGCMRVYRVSEDGGEHIIHFAVSNWWVSDPESYSNETPSKGNIDALADSDLLLIEKKDWHNLVFAIPALRNWWDELRASCFHAGQERIMSLISDTAEEKYIKFATTYPDIFNCVPLHMVASYLGVSRETLSRIRKNYARS